MTHADAIRAIKFDVRLSQRRNWATPEDRQKALAALPDSASKAAPASK